MGLVNWKKYRKPALALLLSASILGASLTLADKPTTDSRPNIVIILADDLGYSDLGTYGSEIETPNIDALAQRGVQFTNFYAGPTCGPSRSMLMSGTDHHLAGLAVNKASLARLPQLQGRTGYEGYLNKRVVSFAQLLQGGGYFTAMTGKWDLGAKAGFRPTDRGFERSFALIEGGASHFGDALGLVSRQPEVTYFEDARHIETLPADFYSSEFYTSQLIKYLNTNRSSGKPFMGYLAFTAPHWPLQVPDDWIGKYRGDYDKGWDELGKARLQRMQSTGLIARDTPVPHRLHNSVAWDSLSPTAKKVESRRMEIYAAMISNMDHHIGRLIDYLKKSGQFDNTLILFLSDNGAEGNNVGTLLDSEYWIPATFDNRLDNMGRMGSYTFLGSGWAQVSSMPRRIYKAFPTDGGIGAPAIIVLPNHGQKTNGQKTGRTDVVATIMDIAPTLLEVAATAHPGTEYQGRQIAPLRGKSMLPYLHGDAEFIHDRQEALGWETYGNRALRQGDWKIVLIWPPYGPGKWQLFNLAEDPGETNDLSTDYPDRLQNMLILWQQYVNETGLIEFEKDLGYGRIISRNRNP